jgi:RNA polymerase sigma-70 factor, ECF subfamily
MTSRSDQCPTCPEVDVEQVHRAEWGRLLSVLIARTRRLDLAEDALAEAFARATATWPTRGTPDNPAAWLYTTASRLVAGRVRAEAIAGRKAPLLVARGTHQPAGDDHTTTGSDLGDDRVDLIMLCCHPALHRDSRSALALRLVIGTRTEEIARLFLVSPATMAARLTRAKRKIVLAGIPLGSSADIELRDRLDEVCRTVYLAFTAGYAPGTGDDLLRVDVAGDAVRLALVLRQLVPDAPQTTALLALLLLQHSRRDARVRDGQLVALADQDRSAWHQDEVRAGRELLGGVAPTEGFGEELRLQALIAAEHASAPTAAATDWRAIASLYATLDAATGSPVVRLNRAVAVAECDGPAAGLELLTGLDHLMPGHHRLAAVRAALERRAGNIGAAHAAYTLAITQCRNGVERAFLERKLSTLTVSPE